MDNVWGVTLMSVAMNFFSLRGWFGSYDLAVFGGILGRRYEPQDLEEMKAFDFEFPPDKREHGFMIAFQGQTLYWNQVKQDFQPEIIKI